MPSIEPKSLSLCLFSSLTGRLRGMMQGKAIVSTPGLLLEVDLLCNSYGN